MAKLNELDLHKNLVDKYEAIAKKQFYLVYQNYWNGIIFKSTPENRDSFVLDCGCGIGRMLRFLSHRYNHVYGVDVSVDMLKTVYKNKRNITVIASDAQGMGFKDKSFDMVICKGSLHHLNYPDKAIKEISRILKKDGFLIVSEPCRDNIIWRKMGLLYVKFSKRFSNHHRLFYSKTLKRMMAQNGFEIQKIRYLGFIAFPLCGIAHQFPIMKFIPFNCVFTKILIKIDEIFMKMPLVKEFYWHIIIYSRKI